MKGDAESVLKVQTGANREKHISVRDGKFPGKHGGLKRSTVICDE